MRQIFDAHAHLGTEKERQYREREKIVTIICAGDAKEAEILDGLQGDWIRRAYGLHPWKASEEALEKMMPWLERSPIIGEIGLDSVWCQVDMDVQRNVFRRQLALASRRKRPAVLHVKGMEKEAAETIRDYPGRYLVHWYSDMNWLDAYLDQDCYFTVGPDVEKDPAVQQVAERADLSRLLVETDGFSAVQWALGEEFPLSGLRGALENSIRWISRAKGVTEEYAAGQIEENFKRFAE